MKTLETDAEINADGSLKLLSPLPDWLKTGERRHMLLVLTDANDISPATTTGDGKAKAGLWKNKPGKFWMSADFDKPLEDFRDYME
ncbi:MAG TPA: DUF2281 domain-containing protein [Methylococcaceae bacterium]|nr:DUF2281 domain-containing protein [Methylococcaceae bacterium]